LELRGELGCVLAVVHFNHKIRPEADSDAEFVEALAKQFGLEFFGGKGDAKKFALEQRVSLETAARDLRYGFFGTLALGKIATAHTLDDQAETVLMKLLRGAGTKGLSGIWPCVRRQEAGDRRQEIIRPMLGVRRREIEQYLHSLGQEWREDATNRDLKHTRNKVRHELLLLLEADYNPNIYQQLADAAEVARGDEEYWAEVVSTQYSVPSTQYSENADSSTRSPSARSLGMTSVNQQRLQKHTQDSNTRADEGVRAHTGTSRKDSNGSETGHAPSLREDGRLRVDCPLRVDQLVQQPLALRRRVVRRAFEDASGKTLDFEHTDALVRFLERRESSRLQLPEYWFAVLDWPKRRLSFEERLPVAKVGTGVDGKTSKKQRAIQEAGRRR
jgi:tRNA(Ile)-lysidine synthetase-like protein